MATRSRIPSRFFARQLVSALSEDRTAACKLARLQLAKETFNLRHPFGARHGQGDSVELISLRITDLCNLRCHTCGQWGDEGYLLGKSVKALKAEEVSLETYKRVVDDVVAAGWKPVWYIWGGEPMLYPGLIELMHYIKDRGMAISLVSNGTNIAQCADDILQTCKIIYLSADGPNAEIHNAQRPGVNENYDNFKDVKESLETLRAEKDRRNRTFPYIIPLSCVSRYNVDVVVDLYEFTRQYADAQIFYLTWWIDAQSAQEHAADFERRFGFKPQTHEGWIGAWKDFDHQAVYDQFEQMMKIFHTTRRCPPIMIPDLATREDIGRYYTDHTATFGYDQCISIYMTMEINSNGDVSLCRDYHDFVIGNIKTTPIADIWKGPAAQTFRASISRDGLMPACRRCCGLMGF